MEYGDALIYVTSDEFELSDLNFAVVEKIFFIISNEKIFWICRNRDAHATCNAIAKMYVRISNSLLVITNLVKLLN